MSSACRFDAHAAHSRTRVRLARKVAQRVVFMDAGEIVEADATDSFFQAPKSERARTFLSKILSH